MMKRQFMPVMIIFIILSFTYSCSRNQKNREQAQHVIQAQDTSTIFFTFNPTGQGYVEKNIFVYFKNHETPSYILLKARVR
jgi:hypothetical protein